MAITLDQNFITQWTDQVHVAFQQKKNKFVPCVSYLANQVGETIKIPTVGAVNANTKATNAEVTILEPLHASKTITVSNKYAPLFFDKLDQLKSNVAWQKHYVNLSVSAINRAIDDAIITALVSGSVTTTTTAGGLTYAKIKEALTALRAAEAAEDDDELYLAVSPDAMSDALDETKLTSSDYMTMKSVIDGKVSHALGFEWKHSTRLPTDTGPNPDVTTCVAWNKMAVWHADNGMPTTEINYVAMRVGWLINSFVGMGSVLVDTTGVVEIPVEL